MVDLHGALSGQGDGLDRRRETGFDALRVPQANRDDSLVVREQALVPSVNTAEEFASLIPSFCRDHEQSRRHLLAHEMTFKEYLVELWNHPERTVRSVAQYQVDAFEHYGYEEKVIAGRAIKDFTVRTFPWQSRSADHRRELIGQEIGTFEYYEFCQRAANDPRPNVMLCVHGHSGSGKSTFFQMRDKMLEDFSRNHAEGALYRLVWRFSEAESQRLGFSTYEDGISDSGKGGDEVRIHADNNTDPIFVIPQDCSPGSCSLSPRERLLESLEKSGRITDKFCKDYFLADGLDPLSSKILSHLLDVYDGDMEKILDKHVRVERWSYSSKLAEGIVSLKPNPDMRADIRPIYMPQGKVVRDEALETLPELFSTGALFLRANRGVLHYADMFRLHQQDRGEADISRFNFLLDTIESGTVQVMSHRDPTALRNVPSFVFVSADTNDHNILEKMQSSGFEQLRERMEFVTFGLITRFHKETQLYRIAIGSDASHPPSPHALETLALFACSTRLLSPDPFSNTYQGLGMFTAVKKLTPVAKALLLEEEVPITEINLVKKDSEELTVDQVKLLGQHTANIAEEYAGGVGRTKFWLYDGGLGLSTRSGLKVAERIIADTPDRSVTAMDVCRALQELVDGGLPYFEDIKRMKAQVTAQVERDLKAERGKVSENDIATRVKKLLPVPEPVDILKEVELYAKRQIQNDLAQSLGLLSGTGAEEALLRYLWHVRSHLSGGSQAVPEEYRVAKMRDDGRASEVVMRSFEDMHLEANRPGSNEDRESLRRTIFGQVAAWSLDNPGRRFDEHISDALPSILEEVRLSGRAGQKRVFQKFLESANTYGRDDGTLERDLQSSDKELKKRAEKYFDVMLEMEQLGYQRDTAAREIVWALTEDSKAKS